jgi:hypothetical protein
MKVHWDFTEPFGDVPTIPSPPAPLRDWSAPARMTRRQRMVLGVVLMLRAWSRRWRP